MQMCDVASWGWTTLVLLAIAVTCTYPAALSLRRSSVVLMAQSLPHTECQELGLPVLLTGAHLIPCMAKGA